LSTLKSASGSNQSLLGAGVEAGERAILGVPVVVTNQAEAGTLVVIDKTAIVSAVGPIRLVRSDDAFFTLDVAAIKIAWRIGMVLTAASELTTCCETQAMARHIAAQHFCSRALELYTLRRRGLRG
jgi:hypothetical protein